ncbi:MAG: ribonuclease D [Candidatus Omnitrophica bacterium]|nr:ribonuclease D [Candidatus Omnitrophota bacterium]
MKDKVIFVDNQQKLAKTIEQLKKENEIAVDTEGNSLYSYYSKICLIQISVRKAHYIIDPIKIKEISALEQVLSNQSIEKIIHAAAYDIQMLYQSANIQIKNLFDTQIAANFLGEKNLGLASLIKKYFGVDLNKFHQKSNWAIRPLPKEMIEYAISDTAYLLPLANILKKQLKLKERIEWVKEECQLLTINKTKEKTKKRTTINIGKIPTERLHIFHAITEFRENLARQLDLPAFRIIDKDTILKIAKLERFDLKRLRQLTARFPFVQKNFEQLLEAINSAGKYKFLKEKRQKILIKLPEKEKREKIEKLYQWRTKKAQQLEIEPHLVLSQKQMVSLVEYSINTMDDILQSGCLKNWQKNLFGKELCEILKKP